jgi:hypothetical protein
VSRFEGARLGGGALDWEIRMRAWGVLKNRALVASLGAVLVFSIGAFIATQITHHAAPAGQANTANTATDTATSGAAATETAAAGGSGSTTTDGPTATPIPPTPTTQRQPTPTGGAGQPFHQLVTVASVNSSANSFTFVNGSTTYTIVVITSGSPKTEIQINGLAQQDLSNLQPGMQADVEGQWRSDGSILAFSVDAKSGGGGGN